MAANQPQSFGTMFPTADFAGTFGLSRAKFVKFQLQWLAMVCLLNMCGMIGQGICVHVQYMDVHSLCVHAYIQREIERERVTRMAAAHKMPFTDPLDFTQADTSKCNGYFPKLYHQEKPWIPWWCGSCWTISRVSWHPHSEDATHQVTQSWSHGFSGAPVGTTTLMSRGPPWGSTCIRWSLKIGKQAHGLSWHELTMMWRGWIK